MSLPDLIDYQAPPAPDSRATWRLESPRAAVLVHDLQRYFLRPYAPGCPALVGALNGTARILSAARAAGVPVFYTAQTGRSIDVVRGLQADLWGRGMHPVPEHTDIVPEVAPAPGDTVLVKHRYSAFAHSDLAEQLAAAGRDQLVITGVYAHIGVLATAFDAFMQEIHPFVVADAVADFTPQDHRRALSQVASCSGVVTTTATVLDTFSPQEPPMTASNPLTAVVADAFTRARDADFAARALAAPDADLFALGLNSLQAFDVLDHLLDEAEVEVDYAAFTVSPTVTFLLAQA